MKQLTVSISDETFERLQELIALDHSITMSAFAEESIIHQLNDPVENVMPANEGFDHDFGKQIFPEFKATDKLWTDWNKDQSIDTLRTRWGKKGPLLPRSQM